MNDLVIVGGLVPSLIVDQSTLPDISDTHAGTMDIDVGLSVSVLSKQRYSEIAERLRVAGFRQDVNERGQLTRQRWRIERGDDKATVDFLIPPTRPEDQGGSLRDIEHDFAAIIAPGLELAFRDCVRIELSGTTILDERASRNVQVSGPGAFVVLKALAFHGRGSSKDAYDLYYVVRNYRKGPVDVASHLVPLLEVREGKDAVLILRRDFSDQDHLGPRRVAEFLTRGPDEQIQADVAGFVRALLRECDRLDSE